MYEDLSPEHVELMGHGGAQEFRDAANVHKNATFAWMQRARNEADDAFFWSAASAIHGSALMSSFKGNWNHEHAKASFAWHEARRRAILAGHHQDCRADNIYVHAYNQVLKEQGHSSMIHSPVECNCAELRRDEAS